MEVKIVDEDGKQVPQGQIGNLWVQNHDGLPVDSSYTEYPGFPAHYASLGFPKYAKAEWFSPADSDRSVGWSARDSVADVSRWFSDTLKSPALTAAEWQAERQKAATPIVDQSKMARMQQLMERAIKGDQSAVAETQKLSEELDAGWGTLMTELSERGLLDDTTIVWMGEFGRTPVINSMGGRDHFPNAWSCVMAGGGIKGGQAYGRTSDDGMKVEEKPVAIGDVLATLCEALGVPPDTENMAMGERPIKIAEGTPIAELLV